MWFTPLPRLRLCTETHVYRHMFTPCLFTDICLPVQTHGKRLARGVEAGFGLRRAGTSGGVGGSGAGGFVEFGSPHISKIHAHIPIVIT